jgi:hypothetical protein
VAALLTTLFVLRFSLAVLVGLAALLPAALLAVGLLVLLMLLTALALLVLALLVLVVVLMARLALIFVSHVGISSSF